MIDQALGPYQFVAVVGSGGFAHVYRATDMRTGETVALKLLREEYAEDPEFLRRFEQEAKTVLSLPPHPNIVRPREYGVEGRSHYLVFDFVEGTDLSELVADGRPLPLPQALSVVQQVAEALRCAHDHKVIHRDIKPQNIKITPQGIAKVLDFGIARTASATHLTRTGMFIGTPEYLPPEIWEGKQADARSDIYAWGVLAHQVFTGRPPFAGDTAAAVMRQHLETSPTSLRSLRKDLPPGYEFIVHKALAKRPDERFQTARDLLGALQNPAAYAARSPVPTPSPAAAAAPVRTPSPSALPALPSRPSIPQVYLVGTAGSSTGRNYVLKGGVTLLGRDPRLDISISDGMVSAQHARIERGAHGYLLRDLESRNGTFVNGRRVQGAAALRDGDQVRVGTSHFVFRESRVAGARGGRSRGSWALVGQENLWGALAHASAIFLIALPFLPILCPAVVYLMIGKIRPDIGFQAQQAAVFQALASLLLVISPSHYDVLVWAMPTAYGLFAAYRTAMGHYFEYPFLGRLLRTGRW